MLLMMALVVAQTDNVAAPPPPPPAVASTDGFTVGTDTLSSVMAKLGKPFTVMHNSDGTTTAIYSSTRTRVKGTTFIPIVGMFAGGAKAHISTKTFMFDDQGLLKSYSSSDTNTDCNLALGGARCS